MTEKPGFLEQAVGTLRHWQCSVVLVGILCLLGVYICVAHDPSWMLLFAPLFALRPTALKLRMNLAAATLGVSGAAGTAALLLLYQEPQYIVLPGILLSLHGLLYFGAYTHLRSIWDQQASSAKYWWWESWLRVMEYNPSMVLETFEECRDESPGDLLDWVAHIREEAAESDWDIREVDFPGEFLQWIGTGPAPTRFRPTLGEQSPSS